ncbi:MAG: glyoxylase-like metal-dependent hydrolase (beta-lactamase superfamily II) [Planctomycetota bacterium]|jgi:glyoxylase-like metal-dependent hydrolase (beta-lactamase superfamily II)
MSSKAESGASTSFVPRSVQLGDWTITALSDGFFRLDGGAMWGIVPATMWRSMTPPAEDNTISLALRPFLAQRGDDKVLIEVGIGDRWEERERGWYHIDSTETLAGSLRAVGVQPEEITHVVASHCHWDHIGAQVIATDAGLKPHFPNARHFAPASEVEAVQRERHARSGSYRYDDIEAVIKAGLLETYEGEQELLPGVVAHVLGGHSDGVSVITLHGGDETAIFWADIVPTTHHVQPPYIMAYDVDVRRSFEQRSEWIGRAADGGWIGLFYHDDSIPFARIERAGRRFLIDPVQTS